MGNSIQADRFDEAGEVFKRAWSAWIAEDILLSDRFLGREIFRDSFEIFKLHHVTHRTVMEFSRPFI